MAGFVDKVFWKVFKASFIKQSNCSRVQMTEWIVSDMHENDLAQKRVFHAGIFDWLDCNIESRIKEIGFWFKSRKRNCVYAKILEFETQQRKHDLPHLRILAHQH